VPVTLSELADRDERLEPLLARLADPDQDPGRERDPQLSGEADRPEARSRQLVRRPEVRPAARRQPLRRRLQHQPL
jgi:hypothetical protein